RVRDHEFQENLRPAGTADVGRPAGQRGAAHAAEQLTAVEGAVDDHRAAAVGRGRQQTSLGFAVGEVVGELHEVERFALHDGLDFLVTSPVRGGDADVAYRAFLLHAPERGQVCFPVEQVVHLHQVETRQTP